MKSIRFSNEELSALCMALAHLTHGGIGAADGLTLMKEDEKDPRCKALLEQMALWADEGASLADAFRKAQVFPAYMCTLLEVGNRVGKTEETLQALARYYQGRARLDRQLRSALLYPAVLMLVLLMVLTALLVWVLPVFNDVYAQLGSGLTGFAGGLMAFGQGLGKALPWILGVLAALILLGLIPPVRKGLIRWFKKHFGDKGVFGRINTARFIQALSLGLSSGLTAQEAVSLACSMAEGEAPAFRQRCDRCLEYLEGEDTLAVALRKAQLLQGTQSRLLEAGVKGGQAEVAVTDIAQRLLDESEQDLEQQASKAEPIMVLVACVLIGMILLSVMLPLMHIMTAIG